MQDHVNESGPAVIVAFSGSVRFPFVEKLIVATGVRFSETTIWFALISKTGVLPAPFKFRVPLTVNCKNDVVA